MSFAVWIQTKHPYNDHEEENHVISFNGYLEDYHNEDIIKIIKDRLQSKFNYIVKYQFEHQTGIELPIYND